MGGSAATQRAVNPTPRLSTAVISVFVAALALSVQPASAPQKPWIQSIRTYGDTAWFEGERARDSVRVRYCLALATGEWCAMPRAGSSGDAGVRVPRRHSSSVALTPDLALVCRPPVEPSGECEAFAIRARGDTALYPLVPTATPPVLAMLQRAAGIETEDPPRMSEFVTAWVTTADAVWFGLGGGFPEGIGAYGGLLRFDRVRRTVETVVHEGLADATVTALAVDEDRLWVGTIHPAEYGPVGSTGVLWRELHTGRWTRLDPTGAWLPDRLVQAIAASRGMVFIATQDGLAAFDTRRQRWSVRYFRLTARAGSAEYALVERRPRD
jgi:hypothetical protein